MNDNRVHAIPCDDESNTNSRYFYAGIGYENNNIETIVEYAKEVFDPDFFKYMSVDEIFYEHIYFGSEYSSGAYNGDTYILYKYIDDLSESEREDANKTRSCYENTGKWSYNKDKRLEALKTFLEYASIIDDSCKQELLKAKGILEETIKEGYVFCKVSNVRDSIYLNTPDVVSIPNSYETDREEEWYNVGICEGYANALEYIVEACK